MTKENILTPHQASALNYGKHISLTANAGSGKTFVLSRRYLEIVLNENIPLRNIAAITFTDKAASELYRKIADEVDKRLSVNTDENLGKKLRRIRRELVSANISTIHSFCIDILKEYPVEASLDANFQPIDESLSNELIELCVEETIKTALYGKDEDIRYLIRIFASKKIFAEELFSLIKNRKNVADLAERIYKKTEIEIADFFYETYLNLVTKIFTGKKDLLIKNLCIINNAVIIEDGMNEYAISTSSLIDKLKKNNSSEEYLGIINNLIEQVCTKGGSIKKKGYLQGKLYDKYSEHVESLERFFKKIKPVLIPENHNELEIELAKFGNKLIKFFIKCCTLYEEKKKENGYLDFEDILLFTGKILKNKNVRKFLSGKFNYIMVDEYQDTNEIQYQIFLPILNDLKTGNLFVVGDEKQSIYMFRDAELEVFSETKKNIGDVSGLLLTLPDSFRMSPEISLFTNILFKNLFKEPNPVYNEVEYSELVCARNDDVQGKIEILIGDEDVSSQNSEPELVAKKILKLKQEKSILLWDNIAVLVRKRKNFRDLEKVFSKYKIPFNVVGGTGFYQKQSVYDIYNYFNFLLDTQNSAALVGILRSPFFNLSDAEIFQVSRENGNVFWNKFQNYCKSHAGIIHIKDTLAENISLVKSYEPTILLRKILNETNYLAVLASKPNGIQEVANLEKLITLTTSFSSQHFRTTYDYLNFLKESIEKTDDESQASVAEGSNSVKIMTLHQAKGLEFNVVFLYKCDEVAQINSVASKKVTVAKKIGLLTKVPINENYFSEYESAPVVNIYSHIAKKKDIAEIKRLFYVGVTRAMDYLFISAAYKKDFSFNENSFMGLLAEGLCLDYNLEEYKISSPLKFLKREGDNYITKMENVSLTIPVIREVPEFNNIEEISLPKDLPSKLYLNDIKDIPEGEIISATKLSIFNQCSLKYKLTYELGFTKLVEYYKTEKSGTEVTYDEFNPLEENKLSGVDEDNSFHNFGNIKGRIIHKILQQETDKSELEEIVEELAKEELELNISNGLYYKKFIDDIVADLTNFYSSSGYNELKQAVNYRNEFEIYCKEENFFLFGIIDRIIFNGKKATIIDFKTDDIEKSKIEERFGSYLNQLKFYSYIVSRLYKNIEEFELRIIFIKYPDAKISLNISAAEMDEIKNSVKKMVAGTRSGLYEKNFSHCSKCIFSINHKQCIVN